MGGQRLVSGTYLAAVDGSKAQGGRDGLRAQRGADDGEGGAQDGGGTVGGGAVGLL